MFINENYLKLQHKLKSDRQVVKVGDDSSGLLLKDNRVFVEQQPSEEQEVATKKYVDDNAGGGGATTFTGLTDTPSSLSGEGSKFVKVNSGGSALEFVDSAKYWHQIVSGYRINNTSTTVYYTFYRFWFENWSNSDSDPTSVADSDIYSSFFIAPRAGSITNIRLQGWANDTGATDPVKFYIYKAAQSSNEDSTTASSCVTTSAITPPGVSKTFTHSEDFSSDNTFSEGDNLYIWLKKDSNSGNQDLYYNICISGEYS